MAEKGDDLLNNIGKRIAGISILVIFVSIFSIVFLNAAAAWLFGEYFISIYIFLFGTSMFLILVIGSIIGEKAYVTNGIAIYLGLIGVIILFGQFLFHNDIGSRVFGLIMVIFASILISWLSYAVISGYLDKKNKKL
jgi:hypothetical protein